jgi:bifunctional UDP-N-acetylglucosamine pyrophosphorylase/glucosamine-1-phosphate N-acetyltransferase
MQPDAHSPPIIDRRARPVVTIAPSPRTVAVILAAGLGTRMRSRTPKLLHPICGRPMLAWVIDAAREVTGERPLVVYSPATSAICETFA